jgi:hypothetical protein
MNYFISRNDQQYGPYTLADLQRYVASGNILLTDLTRSEGMTDWVPVSQVIGNIPVPVSAPAGTVYQGPGTVYQGGTGTVYQGSSGTVYQGPGHDSASPYPDPPNLHWGIVFLLAIVTCGLFYWVWAFVQAVWMRKVQPESKALFYYIGAVVFNVLAVVFSLQKEIAAIGGILNLVSIVVLIAGAFSMRASLEDHYNTAEPIGLTLSGVMTFFFATYYFQYHFSRIIAMKRSGQLSMVRGA